MQTELNDKVYPSYGNFTVLITGPLGKSTGKHEHCITHEAFRILVMNLIMTTGATMTHLQPAYTKHMLPRVYVIECIQMRII